MPRWESTTVQGFVWLCQSMISSYHCLTPTQVISGWEPTLAVPVTAAGLQRWTLTELLVRSNNITSDYSCSRLQLPITMCNNSLLLNRARSCSLRLTTTATVTITIALTMTVSAAACAEAAQL